VNNGIYRYTPGDAAPTRIVSADAITSLTVDDTYVYYTRQNVAGVWRAPLTIAAPVQISDGNVAKIVAQDADFIYAISSTCCVSDIYKVIK
jgi:hypothetical protein